MMAKTNRIFIALVLILLHHHTLAQFTVEGNFKGLIGQKVILKGFDGFEKTTLDSATVSSTGDFKLRYTKKDIGIGLLVSENKSAFLVILENQNILLHGDLLSSTKDISILSGKENLLFEEYFVEHTRRKSIIELWICMKGLYDNDTVFNKENQIVKTINSEIDRIQKMDSAFLKQLEESTYLSWYLPIKKKITDLNPSAQDRTLEIPETIDFFRKVDYKDKRLYTSDLLIDLLESHFWLITNSGLPIDSIYLEINKSIDFILDGLIGEEVKYNNISNYIFNILEKQSLFPSSEYMALKILTQKSCTINESFSNQLESYRATKVGKVGAEINLEGLVFKNGKKTLEIKSLSSIKSKYKVLIFGASWCPKCAEELALVHYLYNQWKQKDVEVVFISLDTQKENFENFTKIFQFISFCDFKKWETKSAKDYHIFATPTIFLLNEENKIILRPSSAKQLDGFITNNIASQH